MSTSVFDEIVEFSELEKFIDMQVRHYSSGMYVRLGFAVAVNVDPDILLVDEVLAVGDEAFQRKCLDRVARFQREGRTILFVTHAADLVRRICDRVVVLDHGLRGRQHAARRERADVPRAPAAARTARTPSPNPRADAPTSDDAAEAATHRRADGRAGDAPSADHRRRDRAPRSGEPDARGCCPTSRSRCACDSTRRNPPTDLNFGIAIHDDEGDRPVRDQHADPRARRCPMSTATVRLSFVFDRVPLLDGTYLVTLAIQTDDEGTVYDWRDQAVPVRGHEPRTLDWTR